jgi:hypothetical protein
MISGNKIGMAGALIPVLHFIDSFISKRLDLRNPHETPQMQILGTPEEAFTEKYMLKEWQGKPGIVVFAAEPGKGIIKGEKGIIASEVLEGKIVEAKAKSKIKFDYKRFQMPEGQCTFFIFTEAKEQESEPVDQKETETKKKKNENASKSEMREAKALEEGN